MSIGIQQIHNLDGSVTVIDNRVFSECVEFQLNFVRETAKQLILEVAPEHKQRNAALGLLSEQETQNIKEAIQLIRTNCNIKEQQILSVVWDGDESTRAAACDAVQRIN